MRQTLPTRIGKLPGVFNYEFGCLNCGWRRLSEHRGQGRSLAAASAGGHRTRPDNPDKTTVLAERGETVTFKVVVVNNGMVTSTASEAAGCSCLAFSNGLAGRHRYHRRHTRHASDANQQPLKPNHDRRHQRKLHSGIPRQDCVNVNYEVGTYWECGGTHADDHCRQDGESKAQNIILRNPRSITTSPFALTIATAWT